MSKKPVKSNNKLIPRNNSQNIFKRYNIKISYIFYFVFVFILLVNLLVDVVTSDEYQFRGCSMDECNGCADSCSSCDACVEKIEEDNSPETTANATAVELYESPACQEQLTASSSVSSEVFTYSFKVVSCSSGVANVFLDNNQTTHIYNGHSMGEWASISGSGIRAASEGFREICVEFNGQTECG
jgi:hypothetical protein